MFDKSKTASFFGFLNCLVWSILAWIVLVILYLCRQIEGVYFGKDFSITWDISDEGWLANYFLVGKDWEGFAFGCNIVVLEIKEDERWLRTLKHERKHIHQFYTYGILFPILYILESVRVYLFKRDLHSYYDNYFEIEARKYAGQPVKIPRERWKDGPNDRWAWW